MKVKSYLLAIILIFVINLSGCNSQEKLEQSIKQYDQTIKDLQYNFIYEGFEEIMHEESHLLALPMEYKSIDKADNFLFAQKLFVYKSKEQGVVIMLQVTHNRFSENQWISSIDYSPIVFNAPNSKFGDFYVEEVPDIDIACNSFSYENCNYSITCFSRASDSYLAATTLIDFSNNLIEYLTNE